MACLDWERSELNTALPPALAYAVAWHLVLAAATLFHARDPFPVGGMVEDPRPPARPPPHWVATCAMPGCSRHLPPVRLTIRQGEAIGRPSRREVAIPAAGGITVSGFAVDLSSGVECGSTPTT